MPDFKAKTVLVYDYGLFCELAIRLAQDFSQVYYYVPWKAAYPKSTLAAIGDGLPNIHRILDFLDIVDSIDLFVFPDVYNGDLQVHLRELGKNVWGSGRGDTLELDRWETKQLIHQIGLPVIHTEKIIGLDNLKNRLAEVENKFIKTPKFRGDMETYHHTDYRASLAWLDELAHMVGPRHKLMEFIVEDFIPGIEIGYDGYCIDGKFPTLATMGYEIKDAGFVGKVKKYGELPESLKVVNERLSPILKGYQYRNFFSTEVRVGPDKKPYLTDPCTRMGSPPGEVYLEMFSNLSEIIWYGAQGQLIDPVVKGQYTAELLITSEWGKKNWLEVRFPEALRRWVKLRNLTKIDGSYYVIPQEVTSEVGAVCAVADSMEAAIRLVKERAEQVKGYLATVDSASLDKAKEAIAEGKKYGVTW